MMPVVVVVAGWRESGVRDTEGGRYGARFAIRTIHRVISSTFTGSTLPRFRGTYPFGFLTSRALENSPNSPNPPESHVISPRAYVISFLSKISNQFTSFNAIRRRRT